VPAVTAEHAVYVARNGEQVDAEDNPAGNVCTGSVTKPTAPPEYLCVYAGKEVRTNEVFRDIAERRDEPGTDEHGALVAFEVEEIGPANLEVAGTWATTGP
jgi:hypothetical protein